MNTIIKSISAVALVLFMIPIAFGQENKRENSKEKKEKIEQMKITFITNELALTIEESDKFWPVYNEMESKLKTEKRTQRKLEKELRENHSTLSDADSKSKVTAIFDSEQKEIAIKRDYYNKIGDQIGYKKSTKLLSLEQKFKRELMQQLKEKKQGGQAQPNQNRK
ncbi:MAG: hypothetical protein QNL61_00550 [Crocinitomicaceae bacterium]|jgi:hypothetical protein